MKDKLITLAIILFSVFGGIFFGVNLVYYDYNIGPLNIGSAPCKPPITYRKIIKDQEYNILREDSTLNDRTIYYWEVNCCCEKFINIPL